MAQTGMGGQDCAAGVGKRVVKEGGPYLIFGTFLRTIKSQFRNLQIGAMMPTLTITEARSSLYQLVDSVANSHEPVLITGKRANAVLLSEEDWRSINETLYLLNIPGMRESILAGMQTPIDECSDEVEW